MSHVTTSSRRITGAPGNHRDARIRTAVAQLRHTAATIKGPWVIVGLDREVESQRGRFGGAQYTDVILVAGDSIDAIGVYLQGEAEQNCLDMGLFGMSIGVEAGSIGF